MRGQVTQIQKDSSHRSFILVAFYSLNQSCSNYDKFLGMELPGPHSLKIISLSSKIAQHRVQVLAGFWPHYRCFQTSEGSQDMLWKDIIPLPFVANRPTRKSIPFTWLDALNYLQRQKSIVSFIVIMSGNETIHRREWWRARAGPLYPEVISKASLIFATQTLDLGNNQAGMRLSYFWGDFTLVRNNRTGRSW